MIFGCHVRIGISDRLCGNPRHEPCPGGWHRCWLWRLLALWLDTGYAGVIARNLEQMAYPVRRCSSSQKPNTSACTGFDATGSVEATKIWDVRLNKTVGSRRHGSIIATVDEAVMVAGLTRIGADGKRSGTNRSQPPALNSCVLLTGALHA